VAGEETRKDRIDRDGSTAYRTHRTATSNFRASPTRRLALGCGFLSYYTVPLKMNYLSVGGVRYGNPVTTIVLDSEHHNAILKSMQAVFVTLLSQGVEVRYKHRYQSPVAFVLRLGIRDPVASE
jgi:hypothetical protein